tara:strand:+ start:34341 stop:34985 length:645 start_codon:yes stop_codon:yes gene_type:complete
MIQEYDYENHWNKAYQNNVVEKLGWFEDDPVASIDLIEKCNLSKDALIFNAGAGATTLITLLLEKGYSNILVNDISSLALDKLKSSLNNNSNVSFIVDDLTNPTTSLNIKNVDLWHDRAVLHFFTSKDQQLSYFNLLKKIVRKGGYVIFSEFGIDGAKKCCGLDIVNYSEKMLQDRLGEEFTLLESFNHQYNHPSNGNTRKYIYTLFKRKTYLF